MNTAYITALADDDQHAGEAGKDRDPARRAELLAQHRGADERDQDRHGEEDGRRDGELQVLQRPEIDSGHGGEHHRPQRVPAPISGADERHAAQREKERAADDHVHDEAQPDHHDDRQAADQPLRAAIEHREDEVGEGDDADADEAIARAVGLQQMRYSLKPAR
jgi:hypothetical protein